MSRRFLLWYGAVSAALLGLWSLAAYLIAPRLVRSAYEGESFGFVNRLISGQGQYPVEYYLDQTSRLANTGTLALVAALTAGILVRVFRAPLGRWLIPIFRAEPRGSAREVVSVGAFLGMVFGLLEATAAWIRFRADGVISAGNNPDTLWMAPVVLGALFALIAVVLFLALGVARRGLAYRVVVGLCGTLGVFGVIRGLRLGFHPAAVWVLSIALGVQLARVLDKRPGALRFVRRSTLPVAGLLAVAVAVVLVGGRVMESRRLAALPEAAEAPNVLLIVLDTVRGESMGLYGYARPNTPEIERHAAEGVVFDRAIASAPWTLPTHATLFTGRWDHELSTDWETPLDDEYPTLAEFLAERGYATGGFVANAGNAAAMTGLGRGFARYADHPRSLDGWLVSAFIPRRVSRWIWPRISDRWPTLGRKYAPSVNQEFLGWLDGRGERPFFAFLNYFDAHGPYEIRREFLSRLPAELPDTTVVDAEGVTRGIPPRLRDAIDGYDSSIGLIDHTLGRLFEELDARGALDNTVVIITSDHGEHLGDRGLMDHGNSLYSQLLLVPLTIRFPGHVPAGTRVSRAVTLRDIPATIVDLAGLDGSPFPGGSLARHWEAGDGQPPEPVLAEVSESPYEGFYEGPTSRGAMKSIVLGSLHYIRNGDGSEELYDLSADPREMTDLADSEAGRQALPELRSALERTLAGEPRLATRAGGRADLR